VVEGEYLIDTNIFLEVLLEQDDKNSCLNLLKLVEEGENYLRLDSFPYVPFFAWKRPLQFPFNHLIPKCI